MCALPSDKRDGEGKEKGDGWKEEARGLDITHAGSMDVGK